MHRLLLGTSIAYLRYLALKYTKLFPTIGSKNLENIEYLALNTGATVYKILDIQGTRC